MTVTKTQPTLPTLRALALSFAAQPRALGIDGVIGAGKSTLGRLLAALFRELQLPVHFFSETAQLPLLELFIADPKQHGAAFQAVMANDAVNRQRAAALLTALGHVALVERPVFGNRVFAAVNTRHGNIAPSFHADFYERMLPPGDDAGLDATLFLHVDHACALDRMQVRGEACERAYEDAYLGDLSDAYFLALLKALRHGRALLAVPWSDETSGAAAQLEPLLRYASSVLVKGERLPRVRCMTTPPNAERRDDVIGPLLDTAAPLETYWGSDAAAQQTAATRGLLMLPWRHYTTADRRGRCRLQLLVVAALCALCDIDIVFENDAAILAWSADADSDNAATNTNGNVNVN